MVASRQRCSIKECRLIAVSVLTLAVASVVLRSYVALVLGPISSDEAFSWRMARFPLPEALQRLAGDVHPPLHYLLLKLWIGAFGDSLLSMRGMSVVLGMLTMAAAVMLAWIMMPPSARCGKRLFLVAVCMTLFGISWWQILVSATARMYSLGAFLALSTVICYVVATRTNKIPWWIATGFLSALLCYTHYVASFSVLVIGCFAILRFGCSIVFRNWKSTQKGAVRAHIAGILLGALTFVVMIVPLVPMAIAQFQRVNNGYWIPRVSLHQGLQVLIDSWSGMDGASVVLMVGFFAVVGVLSWPLFMRREAAEATLLAAMAIGPFVLSMLVQWLTGSSVLIGRVLVFGQVFFLVWLSLALGEWRHRPSRACITALLVGTMAICSHDRLVRMRTAEDASPVAEFLTANLQSGDVVLVGYSFEVARLEYELFRLGVRSAPVQWRGSLMPEEYQLNHVASLRPDDVAPWWQDSVPEDVRRIWTVGDAQIYLTCDVADPTWKLLRRLRPKSAMQRADYIVSEFVPDTMAHRSESKAESET